jgi:hypothetical protein
MACFHVFVTIAALSEGFFAFRAAVRLFTTVNALKN